MSAWILNNNRHGYWTISQRNVYAYEKLTLTQHSSLAQPRLHPVSYSCSCSEVTLTQLLPITKS
jgi:hypothetical protein